MVTAVKKIRVVLVGCSGYAGLEVMRLLARHGQAELVGVFGSADKGPVADLHPSLAGLVPFSQYAFDIAKVAALNPDLAILCAPHKVAMSYVPQLRAQGIRCIDCSADYRLSDRALYEKWYCPHTDPAGLAEAVYGLPEYFADKIRTAGLVANPGCYPTSATLPLAPILRAGLIHPENIICNSASGVSGAGRSPALKFHFPERNENFEAYGVGNHRHTPEIEANLKTLSGLDVDVLFQPHLAPMDRGILSTIYAQPTRDVTSAELTEVLQKAYAGKPFVRVRNPEKGDPLPATKYVTYTNFCDIAAIAAKGRVILIAALDNMVKGAAGQIIQNMNLMFGFDETTGLH